MTKEKINSFIDKLRNHNKMTDQFRENLIKQCFFNPKCCYDLQHFFITKQFLINILYHNIAILET